MHISTFFNNVFGIFRKSSYFLCAFFLSFGLLAHAETIELTKGLSIARIGQSGRVAIHTDAIESQIVEGRWKAPQAGDSVKNPQGETQKWEPINANDDGWFQGRGLRGGYLYFTIQSEHDKIMMLEPAGHSFVYINGIPRTGDVYSYGWSRLPIQLNKGVNDLLVRVARGQFRAKLTEPEADALFNSNDLTLPDRIIGEETNSWAGVIVINAANEFVDNLVIRAELENGNRTVTPVPKLLPLSTRKVAVRLEGQAPTRTGEDRLELTLLRKTDEGEKTLHTLSIKVRVRGKEEVHKRTFISHIDGSVQYYGVNPAKPPRGDSLTDSLFFSLHGASVEALGQAEAYSPKTWGHLVAPTNRRPYGFDWEEWGRKDALEVLSIERVRLGTTPEKTYLTGHSMGGHGTWNFGLTYPDQFGAIAPCAGWVSFWSYAQTERFDELDPIERIMRRATASSDTMGLSKNAKHFGVFISHGGADDVVPPTEARTMYEHLRTFHNDVVYDEVPGQGHWWDLSDEPGADCVDWPPLFDFLARHKRFTPESIRDIDFTTHNPGVSSQSYWVNIEAQQILLQPSSIQVRYDPWKRRFTGSTENILRLSFDVNHIHPEGSLTVELDKQRIENIPYPAKEKRIYLRKNKGTWEICEKASLGEKGPHRNGPFKEAFDNQMVFVYGTQGSRDENAWALAKAQYDAETFWYRGNGSIDVVADKEFDPWANPDRGVILYGNADTNSAWKSLLKNSPVQVEKSKINIGDRTLKGRNLACLFLQPRPGSDIACVAAFSGTGISGMRLCDQMPIFLAGTGFPDCLVVGSETLMEGVKGVRAAGFFGLDWSVKNGDFAWRE